MLLFGAPGAGKGTQGKRLSEHCRIPKFATGDILRDAVRDDSPLGREAKCYMDRGDLVPDEVMLGLIREVLASPAAQAGFILDGFPRTLVQAEGLKAALAQEGRELDFVIYFDVSGEELLRRMRGRRVCPQCGAVYNVSAEAPQTEGVCDRCGGRLEQREDDMDEATLVNRLRVYRENTEPLLEWYGTQGAPRRTIDATGSVDEVFEKLVGAVGCS